MVTGRSCLTEDEANGNMGPTHDVLVAELNFEICSYYETFDDDSCRALPMPHIFVRAQMD